MEYRLALSMDCAQNEGLFFSPISYVNLTNTPCNDFVNPGLGQITRLFDLYVPLHSMKSPTLIEKQNNEMKPDHDQKGAGENVVDEEKNTDSVAAEKNEPSTSSTVIENPTLKRKLEPGLQESFQHPKVKIGKLSITSNQRKPKSTVTKEHKFVHKFNII